MTEAPSSPMTPFMITREASEAVLSLLLQRTAGPREAHAVLVTAFILLSDLNTEMTGKAVSLDELAVDVAHSIRTARFVNIDESKPN